MHFYSCMLLYVALFSTFPFSSNHFKNPWKIHLFNPVLLLLCLFLNRSNGILLTKFSALLLSWIWNLYNLNFLHSVIFGRCRRRCHHRARTLFLFLTLIRNRSVCIWYNNTKSFYLSPILTPSLFCVLWKCTTSIVKTNQLNV